MDTDNLQTFLDMARRGMAADADDADHAAYRMAMTAIDDSPLLSEQQLLGFALFAAVAHHNPEYLLTLLHDDSSVLVES